MIGKVGTTVIPIYADIVGFVRGPAEVGLTTLGLAQPFPGAQRQQLLGVLVQRAKQQVR